MKLFVPLSSRLLKRQGMDNTIRRLHEVGADRVFLAVDRYYLKKDKREIQLSELRSNTKILKNEGFEVGAWLWAFWVDGKSEEFTYMTGIDGKLSRLRDIYRTKTFKGKRFEERGRGAYTSIH